MNTAIAESGHPGVDYRTPDGAGRVQWVGLAFEAHLQAGTRVLDLGSGAGKVCFELARLGLRVTGIDCAAGAVRVGRTVAEDIGAPVSFVRGDYTRLPFRPASFEAAILAKNLIECSYSEAEVLAAEVKRVLVPGGRLLVYLRDPVVASGTQGLGDDAYEVATGRLPGQVNLPEQGEYDYPCHFWTAGFAGYVISRHLPQEEVVSLGEAYYLLSFRRSAAR